jgi:hypothetical protein
MFNKYLSSFPDYLRKTQFEFSLDGDGIVSFEEWQQYVHEDDGRQRRKTDKTGGNIMNY